jgi:hypothetical protein
MAKEIKNELPRLLAFKDLEIGQIVTKITVSGFQTFEFMGFDPKLKNDKSKYDYAYFMDSFGRVRCVRWYIKHLQNEHIYIGYDTAFIRSIEIKLLEERLESLRNEKG